MKMPFGKYKGEDIETLFFNFPVGTKYPYYGLWVVENNILKGDVLKEFERLLKEYNINIKKYKIHCEKGIEEYRNSKREKAKEYNSHAPIYWSTTGNKYKYTSYNDDYAYHSGGYPDY